MFTPAATTPYAISRYHRPGHAPTGTEVRQSLRELTQFLKNKPNQANTDQMGYAGLILPDNRYILALSANNVPYVDPPTPPMVPNMAGLTAEQRATATYTNQQQWKHKNESDVARTEALQLLLNAGDADSYLGQFWSEDIGFNPADLRNMCDYLRTTYDANLEDERISNRKQLASLDYTGGPVEPIVQAILRTASERPAAAHPLTDFDKCDHLYEKMHSYEPMRRTCRKWRKKPDARLSTRTSNAEASNRNYKSWTTKPA